MKPSSCNWHKCTAVAIENTRLYEAEQRARTHAEEANRIKDEFLAVLSHELRTPLNPILGWIKLLRTRQMDEVKVARALETIERNALLQAQLIEDLLDVSRILRGKINLIVSAVNLQAVVEAALDMVRLAAQAKGIEIDTQFVSPLPTISGDPNRLQQVVCNLLSNAVKFTPNGGRVSVQLWADGSFVKIQIQDNGAGINPHFLPYVFDYFRQQNSSSNRAFGGLGLGLAIVRYLVELHGGTAIAQSPGEGQGAIFTVAFPLVPPSSNDFGEAAAPVELASTPAFSSLQGLRILVVDDEVDTRELLIFTLEQYGAQVLAVGSARVAINCIASSESQFDLLLSDIGMPEMDGYQLIQQVRALPPTQGGIFWRSR
uniref:ATP-binding protein n=1 Tax=Desertifilum tharense IPPAS B-1220 TaxID=1781255 RepID=A0ACD5GX11_9CYAN